MRPFRDHDVVNAISIMQYNSRFLLNTRCNIRPITSYRVSKLFNIDSLLRNDCTVFSSERVHVMMPAPEILYNAIHAMQLNSSYSWPRSVRIHTPRVNVVRTCHILSVRRHWIETIITFEEKICPILYFPAFNVMWILSLVPSSKPSVNWNIYFKHSLFNLYFFTIIFQSKVHIVFIQWRWTDSKWQVLATLTRGVWTRTDRGNRLSLTVLHVSVVCNSLSRPHYMDSSCTKHCTVIS